MRDYAIVPTKFWITPLAKALRGDPNAQVVALYLKTGPHANMIGLFHCPVAYIAQDTGIPFEGASKALARLSEAGYCDFDSDAEVVFVRDMAPEQVGTSLSQADKRTKAVIREWMNAPSDALRRVFHARYAAAFHLPDLPGAASPIDAPSMSLRSQEHEHEHEHEQSTPIGVGVTTLTDTGANASSVAASKQKRRSQLPDDFAPNEAGIAAADSLALATELERFKNYHAGKGTLMLDWQAAWRTWCGNAPKFARPAASAARSKTAGKHAGFDQLNYREGINADGSFA